jgi:hypothetical protein
MSINFTAQPASKIAGSDNANGGGLIYSTNAVPAGGFSFSSVNGGFNFDLPLASVAMFNNQALDFVKTNSSTNRQFVSNNINQSNALVSGANRQLFSFLNRGVSSIYNLGRSGQDMQLQANLYAQDASIRRAEINVQNTQAANSGGWCFITTAICELDKLPDDCYELQTFRKFRDEYMQADPERAKMVAEYYDIAPKICGRLAKLPDGGKEIYARLRTCFLRPALHYIEKGEFDAALIVYSNMVREADALSRG